MESSDLGSKARCSISGPQKLQAHDEDKTCNPVYTDNCRSRSNGALVCSRASRSHETIASRKALPSSHQFPLLHCFTGKHAHV